jgi:hypothetical protein
MNFLNYIFSFCFIVCLSIFGFGQKKVAILLAEYDENASSNNLQHLVKYNFTDGVMTGKETVISLPTKKAGTTGDYVRFDIGKNVIYKNRYVITGIGNVIDIKTKKLLVAERAELIACSGDSIIFHTNDIFKGKYYSVLNIKTEKYQKVENANYNPVQRPDVEVDETVKPYTITAYYVNGKKDVLVKDAGYGQPQPLLGDDEKRKFQLFWIDKSSFLYANYSKNQQGVSIYKVSIDKTVEKIADITEIPATSPNDVFSLSANNEIYYSCSKGKFLIDIKKKLATKVVFEAIGNSFSVESDENAKYGRLIKFEATELGKKWCKADNAKSISGYAALQNDIVIGTERYAQGVVVWNNITKKWTSIEASSLEEIIGWVEE